LNAGEEDALTRHGALLLTEMGHTAPGAIPALCACLSDPVDLTRYRARRALNRERAASALGRETLEQLARCDRCAGDCPAAREGVKCWRATEGAPAYTYAVDTYLDWSLKEIRHDRPDWLEGWAVAGETAILGRVCRLDDAAWPTFLKLLTAAEPSVQQALLESASWLLRLDRVPQALQEAVTKALLALTSHTTPGVRDGAITALGHLRTPPPAVLEQLLTLASSSQQPATGVEKSRSSPAAPLSRSTLHAALARLAARMDDDDLRRRVAGALNAAGAHAALVRLHVSRQDEGVTLATLRETGGLDNLEGPRLLGALLEAGTDDDVWGTYHERIVALVRELVESNGDLLEELLLSLQDTLEGNEWPPKRLRLAAVAACAEVLPDALNAALHHEKLNALLVKGTQDADSHSSRRFAITALSHLREATPAVVEVLLKASQDVRLVQADAVKAAARFRHLSETFSYEDSLTPLAEALTGPSGARAYVAAQLLAALGSSPAALEVPGLRERIAAILADALRQPNAEREVYLDETSFQGPLSQALFAALVKIWGLPE